MKSLAGPAFLAFSLGLMGTVSQVLTVREQLVAFTGNELTIAVTLAVWILMVAAGSVVMRRFAHGPDPHTASLLIIAGLAMPFQVISIRLFHAGASFFGEAAGPGTVIGLSAAGVLPSAAILGALFVAVVGEAERKAAPRPVSLVYGIEGLGSAFAGLALALYLLEALNPVGVAALAGLVAVAAAAVTMPVTIGGHRAGRTRLVLLAALGLALAGAAATSPAIDRATRQFQWRPLKVEKTVDSRYGNLVIASRDSSYDLFETGMFAFTIPDPLYAEETAHLPLLVHPEPHDVLVIGGAGSGAIREIAKHGSVRSIDYVETDPVLVEALRPFAPPGWMDTDGGPALNMIYGDARQYVSRATKMYDVLIVSAGAPASLQVNRFYTVEFLRSAERVLDRNGVLAMKVAGQGAYLSPDMASLILSLKVACGAVFRNVIVLPGDYVHILASPGLDLDSESDLIMERLARRGINAAFTNQYLLWDRLSRGRRAELDSVLAASGPGRVNSDLRPEAVSAEIKMWEKHFASGRLISGLVDRVSPGLVIAVLLAIGLLAALVRSGSPTTRPIFPDLVALYSMGASTMATQVLIILAVQVTSGYVYTRIAAIVASFMFGMGLASAIAGLKAERSDGFALPEILSACLSVPPLLVLVSLRALAGDPRSIPQEASDAVFAVIAFATGALGGFIFAEVSSRMRRQALSEARAAASVSYSADLLGAAVTGLATGLLVVPGLGLAATAYSIAGFQLIAVASTAISRRLCRRPLPR